LLENSDDEDADIGLDIQLDVDKLDPENRAILNKCSLDYGLKFGDFIRILQMDKDEIQNAKLEKLMEAEKAQYAVRVLF
jgi:hypothetical protein